MYCCGVQSAVHMPFTCYIIAQQPKCFLHLLPLHMIQACAVPTLHVCIILLHAHLLHCGVCCSWVYPVPSFWLWSNKGWLSAYNREHAILGMGAIDFAGSGAGPGLGVCMCQDGRRFVWAATPPGRQRLMTVL